MRATNRIVLAMAGGPPVVALLFLLALMQPGCPHPAPAPVDPGDADAGPVVAVPCPTACRWAESVCPGKVDDDACNAVCRRLGPGYAGRLATAADCDAVEAAAH